LSRNVLPIVRLLLWSNRPAAALRQRPSHSSKPKLG
jgi:hypothetical protein